MNTDEILERALKADGSWNLGITSEEVMYLISEMKRLKEAVRAFKYFRVDSYDDHERGNKDCPRCWYEEASPCVCGGLIHSEFGDEDIDCNYWLYYKCDRCGDDYEFKEIK